MIAAVMSLVGLSRPRADELSDLRIDISVLSPFENGIPGNYRNLPVIDGHKHALGGKGNGQLVSAAPLFDRTAAPALT